VRGRLVALGLGAAVASAVYVRWVRPWELRWGADDDEVAMRAPGDDLVESPDLVATRAITVDAPPESVWPWLVQIGTGRAGWYSYDRLDNKGRPSAREIIPEFQHMQIGDVVAMSEQKGEPYGPSVLALDPPHSMVWGDDEEPHRFTWLWLLRDVGGGQTRLISRIRCRLSWRDPVFALMMELADPIMMRRTLLNIRERAVTLARSREAGQGAGPSSGAGDGT
jgi:hypothetical protein